MARKKRDPNKPGYNRVYHPFWDETREWGDDEQSLALFLLTTKHRPAEGLFCLYPADIAAVRGEAWPIDRVELALVALERRAWLLRDGGWLMIVNALRWDQPWGPAQITGAVRKVNSAPRGSRLWTAFLAAARLWAPGLYVDLTGSEPEPGDAARDLREIVAACLAEAEGHRATLRDSHGTPTGTVPGTVSETLEGPTTAGGWDSPQDSPECSTSLRVSEPEPSSGSSPSALRALAGQESPPQQAGARPRSSAPQPHGNAPGGQRLEPSRSDTEGRRA